MPTELLQGFASLRRQLLGWLWIPFFLVWVLNAAVSYRMALQTADSAYDKSLRDVTLALSNQMKFDHGRVEMQLPQAALDILEADEKDDIYYRINDPHGEFVYGDQGLPPPPGGYRDSSAHTIYYDTEFAGRHVRAVAVPVPLPASAGQYAWIQVAETLVKRRELVEEWLLSMVLPELLLLLLASALIWFGVGRGLRPVARLRDEMIARSKYDLSPFSDQHVVDELKPLILGINELMSRLQDLMHGQQRFIADAAHQLRTPLAGLKVQAELAMRIEDPAEIAHSMRQIHKAAEQSAHLAQQLLALARAEPEGQSGAEMPELEWVAMVREVCTSWVQTALDKNIDLGFETEIDECHMRGDRVLLAEMMNNLLDNALRYTSEAGHVTVRIGWVEAGLQIRVEDDGIGIPSAQREAVFERFYRVLGTGQPGCGLGLAIVREIATRHGGSVHAEAGEQGLGSVFCLVFPAKKRALVTSAPLFKP